VSIFSQSTPGPLRLRAPACRYCAAPALPGSDLCAYHASEAARLAAQPLRAGYRDPAYRRARRAALRRAKGRCEACGVELPRRPDGTLVCQTHHLDGNPTNNPKDGSNLLVCCLACHSGARHPKQAPPSQS
jgi:hypothetical protein